MEITVDIHGMSEYDAIKHLEDVLRNADSETRTIRVIHGYSRGDTLKDMLSDPNKLRSRRIKRRRYTKNRGETLLELY